jgi:hypothetical protein
MLTAEAVICVAAKNPVSSREDWMCYCTFVCLAGPRCAWQQRVCSRRLVVRLLVRSQHLLLLAGEGAAVQQ